MNIIKFHFITIFPLLVAACQFDLTLSITFGDNLNTFSEISLFYICLKRIVAATNVK